MSYRPPGTLGVLRLLAWNAVVRLLRAANVQKARRQREQQSVKPKRRQATARKSGTGLMWLMVLMVPLFLFQATMMSGQAVTNLSAAAHRTAPGGDRLVLSKHVRRKLMFRAEMTEREFRDVLDAAGVDESYRPPRARILEAFRAQGLGAFEAPSTAYAQMDENGIPWRSEQARALFTQCAAVLLLLFAAMSLLSAFGAANATLGGGDWVQWWLLTFPVATRSLVLARVLEYSLVQFFPWFTLFPLTWLVLEALGQPWPAAVAIGATLVTTFLGGAVRLWGETQLRLRCSLHTLRNVQGACTLLSLTLIGTAFWVALSDETPFVFVDFAGSLPAALTLLPASWPIGLRVFGPLAAVLGVLVTAAAFVGSVAATSRALRGGAMRTGGVDAGSRGRANAWRRGRGMGVGGKELSLLRRDRTFLVQTLLVPLFIIALNLIVNPRLGDAEGVGVAIIAYVVGFYGATGGCFQVLSSEGRALWMLYTLPVAAGDVLRHKTRIWGLVCCAFGTGALAVFSLRGGAGLAQFAEDLVFVLLGVWCAAHMAAAISVMGANTTSDSVQRQPKQRYAWLFMFLAGSYSAVLALPELGHRIAGATVFATIAYAMWQRACDRMRWLLDPVRDTRDYLTLVDGGGAMLAFFMLQLTTFAIANLMLRSAALALTVAFVVAGAATLVFYVARLKSRGVPLASELGLRASARPALRLGAFGALVGGVLGAGALGYVHLVEQWQAAPLPAVESSDLLVMSVLGVLAAPIVEELLFRGLLLGAMRRTLPTSVAVVWSSLLFAFVHPMVSWPPVFVVGVVCAVLRERGGYLPACMLLHATYNAVVIGIG